MGRHRLPVSSFILVSQSRSDPVLEAVRWLQHRHCLKLLNIPLPLQNRWPCDKPLDRKQAESLNPLALYPC